MESSVRRRYLFHPVILIIVCSVLPLSRQQEVPLDHFCGQYGGPNLTFTAGSAFSSNLDRLRSTLSSAAPSAAGFYNFSVGQAPDEVHSIVLCRGDVDDPTCRSCIYNATAELRSLCPNYKEAFIWYDSCMFRYSNRTIIGTAEGDPLFWGYNDQQNVSNSSLDSFNRELNDLMNRLLITAAGGGSVKKFATDGVPFGNFLRIYGLAQCTPDLSEAQCNSCLSRYIGIIPRCCERRTGGKVVGPTCNLRYEYQAEPFYSPTPPDSSSPPPLVGIVEPPPDGKNSFLAVVISVVVVVVFLTAAAAAMIILRRRRNAKEEAIQDNLEAESLRIEFDKIREATDDFSEDNKLGQGGFGTVYKGRYTDGLEIAVKRLSKNSTQGRNEFANEVLLLAKLQHRNLLRLLGFASQGDERLLIYEFMPCSSLDKYIDPTNSHILDWDTRYNIITGIARGTQYLHEDSQLRIIHRDLKPSNILLDTDLNPKIADFGMALLFPGDITHASASKVVGTLGYIAPEYIMKSQVSVKTDVYSFGVLVLEIISGQQLRHFGTEGEHLISYAWENWRKGLALNLVDPSLRRPPEFENEVVRCIHLALLCVQENPAERPSMETILQMLSSLTITMAQPLRPAFFFHSPTLTPNGSQTNRLLQHENEDIQCTNNEATISVLSPR